MSYDDWKLASPDDYGYEDEEGCNTCDGFVYKGETCPDCGLKGSITREGVSTYKPESPFITLARMEAKLRCPFKQDGKQCKFEGDHAPLAHWIV